MGYFCRKRADDTMKFSPHLRCYFPIATILKEQFVRLDSIVFDHVRFEDHHTKKRLHLKEVALKGGEGHEAIDSSAIDFACFVP